MTYVLCEVPDLAVPSGDGLSRAHSPWLGLLVYRKIKEREEEQ